MNRTEVIIFSAERAELSKQKNKERTERIRRLLENSSIPYDTAIGSYKGTLENSFLITADNFNSELEKQVFDELNQESVLFVDSERNAWIQFEDEGQKLGKFEQVSPAVAQREEAYTIIGNRGYIVQ